MAKNLNAAVASLTTSINGLRYAVATGGQHGEFTVTRCDLNAAEARITRAIGDTAEGREALAKLAIRAQTISSRLKALSGKVTQLDSATDSKTTAP